MQTQWSKIKKQLEESLCDPLKGRVCYFATSYRHAHDGQGRVCIRVDKREIINMPFTNIGEWATEYNRLCREIINTPFTNDDEWVEFNRMWKDGLGKKMVRQADHNLAEKGLFTPCIFAEAYADFRFKSIEELLVSDNQITRAIAYMDRRIGRRTLEKQKEQLASMPGWLQYFYHLRMSTYDKQSKNAESQKNSEQN